MMDSLKYSVNSDFEKALNLAHEIESQSLELDYKPGLASAYNSLGSLYQSIGKTNKGFDYLKKAIEIKKQLNNPIQLGMGYENLGNGYMKIGDFLESKKYLEKAISIYTQENDQLNLAIGLLNYGAMWLTFEQPDSALIYLLQSDKLFQNYDDDRHLICINLLGYCYGDLNKKDSAYFYMNYTLKEYEKNGDLAGIKNSSNNLAAEYLDDEKYLLAIKYAQKSLEVPISVGGYSEHIKSTTTMARAYLALNQSDSALKYYGKAEKLTSEYYDTEKLRSIQELQTQYETEKKETEIKTLNMERQIQQANINILLLLSGGLGLVLLFFE
jgi:tetratricopeptide (TPR) repeat protein